MLQFIPCINAFARKKKPLAATVNWHWSMRAVSNPHLLCYMYWSYILLCVCVCVYTRTCREKYVYIFKQLRRRLTQTINADDRLQKLESSLVPLNHCEPNYL